MKEPKTESGDSQSDPQPKWPLFSYVEDSRFSVDFRSTFDEPICKPGILSGCIIPAKEVRNSMKRPEATEYAPFYANYVSKVPGSDVINVLESQRTQMLQLFAGRSEREGNFRYAPDKWTVKEVLGHITDTERIFTYRALRIARGDTTPLPGFEQDDFVKNGAFGKRTLADLADEFGSVRGASVALFRSFGEEVWDRRGEASQREVTVRALAFITAGHQMHHRAILEERYFPAIPRA